MSTLKKRATAPNRYIHRLIDEDGAVYEAIRMLPREQAPAVGDAVYLGRRLNNHHGELPQWEIWPFLVEKHPVYEFPKLWYGKTRYLFYKVKK